MRLNWRRSSDAEGHFEAWITQSHQRRVLAGEATSVGPCPDVVFLRELARRSKRISLSDQRVDHAATCPECMSQLIDFRRDTHPHHRKIVFAAAIASCVVIALAVLAIARYRVSQRPRPVNLAAVSQTVNLSDLGTVRGEQPGQLQSVSLSAALNRVTITLPRFSTPGKYEVSVTHDQDGHGVVAQANSVAVSRGEMEGLTVDLDLRKAQAGQYFLATTHEQDQSTYYYPLQIR